MFLKYAFHAAHYGCPVFFSFSSSRLVAEKAFQMILLTYKLTLKRFINIFTFRPRLPVEVNLDFIHCTLYRIALTKNCQRNHNFVKRKYYKGKKQLPQCRKQFPATTNEKLSKYRYSTENGEIKSGLIVKMKELLITFLRLVQRSTWQYTFHLYCKQNIYEISHKKVNRCSHRLRE